MDKPKEPDHSKAYIRKQLKRRRLEKCLTHDDLAALTGLNKTTIYRFETGAIRTISLEHIFKFCKALDVGPDYFLENKEDKGMNKKPDVTQLLEQKLIDFADLIAVRIEATGEYWIYKCRLSGHRKYSIISGSDYSFLIRECERPIVLSDLYVSLKEC